MGSRIFFVIMMHLTLQIIEKIIIIIKFFKTNDVYVKKHESQSKLPDRNFIHVNDYCNSNLLN